MRGPRRATALARHDRVAALEVHPWQNRRRRSHPRRAKRSPFPNPSLPQAGESLGESAKDLFFDKYFFYVFAAVIFGAFAVMEWTARLLNSRVSPWAWTIIAAVAGAMAAWRWFRIKPQLKMLRQGIRGEREVGRMLEDFRRLGYVVFHDIPGDGFNVDHALVGPGGVFAIETKTFSMPAGRKATIDYDGTASWSTARRRSAIRWRRPRRSRTISATS